MSRSVVAAGMRTTRRGLGRLGVHEHLEPTVRRIASRSLGVEASLLHANARFVEDLAIDLATLTQVVVDIERGLHVRLAGGSVPRIETYGDLVGAVVHAWLHRDDGPIPEPFMLRARVVPRPDDRRGIVVRSMPSSRYAMEIIADDARRAGEAACLEITVPAGVDPSAVQWLKRSLATLVPRCVVLRIARDDGTGRNRAVA